MDGMRNRLREHFEQLRRNLEDRRRTEEAQEIAHYKAGLGVGSRWAFDVASLDDLDCLEIFEARLKAAGTWESWFCRDPRSAFAKFHFAVIDPHGLNVFERIPFKLHPNRAARFWQSVGATRKQRDSGEFVQGFADGALIIWRQFKDRNVETS